MSYLELLELVKEGKNPKRIEVYGIKYTWDDADYYSYDTGHNLSRGLINMLNMKYGLCEGNYIFVINDILDQSEKKYLSQVIRPFKDKVSYIKKCDCIFDDDEFILIKFKRGDSLAFPYFKRNYMYKGMETEKAYTLKALGLE